MNIAIDIPKNIETILDLVIYGVNELLEKYHVKSSISYERFTRGIEIAEKAVNIK